MAEVDDKGIRTGRTVRKEGTDTGRGYRNFDDWLGGFVSARIVSYSVEDYLAYLVSPVLHHLVIFRRKLQHRDTGQSVVGKMIVPEEFLQVEQCGSTAQGMLLEREEPHTGRDGRPDGSD